MIILIGTRLRLASTRVPTHMELLNLLKKYKKLAFIVVILGFATNILALSVPKLTAGIIDIATSSSGFLGITPEIMQSVYILSGVALATFVVAGLQIYFSSIFAEKVAYDIRKDLIDKVGDQSFNYIAKETPSRLLTLITSDDNTYFFSSYKVAPNKSLCTNIIT